MTYLVELIKEKNKEVDEKTVEYVVSYLIKEGHLSYTIQYHYEVIQFFKKCVEHYKSLDLPVKCAVQDTCQHFSVSESWIYKLIKKTGQASPVQTH